MPAKPAPKPRPAPPADDLAGRLLDAQVEFVLAELSGDRLLANVERDVDALLAVAATLPLADVVDAGQVKQTVRLVAAQALGSPLVTGLVPEVAGAVHDLPAGDDHHLGDVVDRDDVEALVAKILSMHTLHERLLERLTESPVVATVASRFVATIIADFVQQNRARAEKLPGMSSLLSLGAGAASRVRSATDKHLDQLLGDAAGRSAQYALRRTNHAVLEMLRDAPVQAAVMEIWDLHAGDPVGELREYLSRADATELAALGHALVAGTRETDYAGQVLDAAVDVFFARHGTRDVASLLTELGLTRDDLVGQVRAYAPGVLEAVRADGVLAGLVRERLEPFFRSPQVAALLTG